MGVLVDIFKFVDGTVTAVFTVVLGAISLLLQGAIWLIEAVLTLATGVVDWINNKIEYWWGDKEEAHANGAKATIVNGEALSNFISQQQRTGNYREISLDELDQIQKSAINIMSDRNNQGEAEMIGAEKGYGEDVKAFFNGKGYVSISV